MNRGQRSSSGTRRLMSRSARSVTAAVGLSLLAGCGSGDTEGRQLTGEAVYQRFCFACHAAGASGAPRVGLPDDWRERVAQGEDAMLRNTIAGMAGMPPRGMCNACTDEELQAAIDYMLERSQ
jgi:cytochrome c5